MSFANNTKLKIFKNKRLLLVLAIIWLIACFIIIRISPVKTAPLIFNNSISSCNEIRDLVERKNCINVAKENYEVDLKITSSQLTDMLALFLVPIIFIVLFISLVKWICNYKYEE